MADIYDVVEKYLAGLLAGDRPVVDDLVRRYAAVWRRLEGDVERLAAQLLAAVEGGVPFSPSLVYRNDRARILLAQVAGEIAGIADEASLLVRDRQRDAIEAALAQVDELAGITAAAADVVAAPAWYGTSTGAARRLAGAATDGSPLAAVLEALAGDAADRAGDALVYAIVRGWNPRRVAAHVRNALGGNLARALTVARTETLRAYRETSRLLYVENSHVVRRWRWLSALDARACAVCWAMHGTEHPTSERFASHPACRCALVPVTAVASALSPTGGPDTRPARRRGTSVFARLPASAQRRILGPGKYAGYSEGWLTLPDVVGYRVDRRWGPVRFERALRDLASAKGRAA